MSILSNEKRHGNFTSSEIFNLIKEGKAKGTMGKPCLDYIAEKNMERKLKRSIGNESNARPLTWGKHVEFIVFQKLGIEYNLCSQESLQHPKIDFWCGSPDAKKIVDGMVVCGEIKCPMTMKSFCQLVESKTKEELINNHKDGEKYYWQMVSNSILLATNKAELIVYCPYKDELDMIREMATEENKWIHFATDEELPWIWRGGYYQDLNVIPFDIPQEDIDFMTPKVLEAGKLLNPML